MTQSHKRVKKVDRRSTVVFSKESDLFWIAAMSFLPEGIGGVYVDYSGYNKEYTEFVE